jgi:hypothetical protein
MAATFVVYADSGSNCRWRLVASNGETIASFGGIVLLDVRRAEAARTSRSGAAAADVTEE